MDLKTLQSELNRLHSLVEQWQTPEDITPIERDLVKARLREIYEALCFDLQGAVAEPMPIVSQSAVEATTPVAEPEPMAEEEVAPFQAEETAEETIAPFDAAAFIALDSLLEDVAVEPIETAVEPVEEESAFEPEEEESEPIETLVEEPVAEEVSEPVEEAPMPAEEPEMAVEETPAVEVQSSAKEEVAPLEEKTPSVVETAKGDVGMPTVQSLFGEEEAIVRHRHKQRVIMSLYDATPEPPKQSEPEIKIETLLPPQSEVIVVEAEPEVIEMSEEELTQTPAPSVVATAAAEVAEPIVESLAPQEEVAPFAEETPTPTLGESMPYVQTLGDKFAAELEVSEVRREPVTDLRRAVSFNDKFLLIQELFNGNGSLYEITIRRLNEFDNFDDCMIYIAENFAWNPNSDGAKLMMDLLERKFLQ
ncbi:MAG: hypothetical protein IKZ12_00220 [Alistipes sp.]|nr:hypothetical protein [Alistipes sp.]